MADRLIFVRKKRNSTGKSEVIRVDAESYNEVVGVAHEADISVARAASEMIKFAIEHIDFVNEEDLNEGE